MDRQHRHDLKHDKFVDEMGALSAKARDNQRILIAIGSAIVVAAIVSYGIYFFRSNREANAQQALATAIETYDAEVGEAPPEPQPGQPAQPAPKFKTEEERNAVAEKQFKEIRAKHSGTDSADIAALYLAQMARDRGDTKTALQLMEEFVSNQKKHILANAARFSVYQLRIDSGQAPQVIAEVNAELAKAEPVIPGDALLMVLAHAYEAQGDETKSRDVYRRITTEFPESPYVVEAQRRVGQA